MKCKLPFKGSLQNSKAFLQDMDIIGEDYKILDDMEFDKVTFELEKDNIQTYKVSGRPWIRDIVRGGMYAEPNLEVLERIDQKRKDLGLYEDQLSAEVPLPLKDNRPISTTQYQNVSDQSIGITASEKTIRDLAARMSDKIGIPVMFESDRTKQYKGRIIKGGTSQQVQTAVDDFEYKYYDGDTAVVNLAYATLDTPIHEILGHPIIRSIKYGGKSPTENPNKLTGEFLDNFKKAKIGGEFVKTDLGYKGIKISDTHYANLIKTFDGSIDKRGEFRAEEEMLDYAPLYQNLLKELEYGRGKDVLDRIKRDYITKEIYLGTDKTDMYEQVPYTLEEQQEEAIVELMSLMVADKLNKITDKNLISLLKQLLKQINDFIKSLLNTKELNINDIEADNTKFLIENKLKELIKNGTIKKEC